MVNARLMAFAHGTFQGGQGQGLIDLSTELPAMNRAGGDMHEDRQRDKLPAEPLRSDVGDPDRIRLCEAEPNDQVGIARVGMVTVRRAAATLRRVTGQSQLTHETAHALPVHHADGISSQLRCDAPNAVGRPFPGDALNMRPRFSVGGIWHHSALPRMKSAAQRVQHGSDDAGGIACRQLASYLEPLLPVESGAALFATSTSSVNRPTSRSSLANCASAFLLAVLPTKMSETCATKLAFQRVCRSGLS